MTRALVPAVLLLLNVLSSACAGPLVPTGYLRDYSRFDRYQTKTMGVRVQQGEDRTIDRFFLTRTERAEREKSGEPAPTIETEGIDQAAIQPVLFVVHPPRWLASWSPDGDDRDAVLFTVRERFYRYLLRQYPSPVRVRYAYAPQDPVLEGYRVLDVETAVTDAKPGAGWLRYVIGYGAGATVLQLEGRIREHGQPVAEFAIRQAHAGYPNGFLNTRVFNASYCLRYAAEEAIGEVTEHLRATIPAARVRPGHTINLAGSARH